MTDKLKQDEGTAYRDALADWFATMAEVHAKSPDWIRLVFEGYSPDIAKIACVALSCEPEGE